MERSSSAVVVLLDGPSGRDRRLVGGKIVELSRLRAAGLPVPDGFAIPTWALETAMARAGLLEEARAVTRSGAAALRAAIQRLELPEDWRRAWVDAAARLGGRLAVRSSARSEDGHTRSHAGLHATLIGLEPEAVPDAVRTIWGSLYTDEALVYRGTTPAADEMAVLVQSAVRSSVSGVLFSVNPLTGSSRELVVEAVWGQGEALVGGHVTPQAYVVRRPGRLRRLLRRPRLVPLTAEVPDQDRWWPPDGGPPAPLPAGLRGQRALTPAGLVALCRLGLQAEDALGEPVDVEWARDGDGSFQLLQARPVTATASPAPPGDVLWTRRFVGERWPDPATPLGWSLVEPVLSWFIAYPHTQERLLGGGPALRLVQGRPYVNATVFRRLAFKLPGVPPPRFLLELLPPAEADAWRRRRAGLPELSVYASLLTETWRERRWRRFAWNPLTNPDAWRRWERRLATALHAWTRPPASVQEAIRRVEDQQDLARDYVGVHVVSLLHANLCWQLLDAALAAALPARAEALMEALAVGGAGNATLQTNRDLWRLARDLTDDDLACLEGGAPLRPEASGPLQAFLDRHGHRALASWEVMSPRWHREPWRLAPLLAAQRGEPVDPAARAEARQVAWSAAIHEVLRDAPGPWLPVLLALAGATRRYLLLRENQRHALDRLLDAMQRTLLGLGEGLVVQSRLARPDDVAWLTWSELVELLTDRDAAAPHPADRREAWENWAAEQPPVSLTGGVPPPQPSRHRLRGLGAGGGRVRGTVRVLRSASEGHRLRAGEVLVTHALDPSWTPLLLSAGAAIVELGGVLSHGAVVAREYGVPMVVDVEDATRVLRDGDEVTVDGRSGTVWLHP